MRLRPFLVVAILAALLIPAAAPWCATASDDRMPCCKSGARCDLGMAARDCCGMAPAPATPRAPLSLAAAPGPDRSHDGSGHAVLIAATVLPAPVRAAGHAPTAGPPRARATPIHLLNAAFLC
jgi:hypothetical protein